jgi:hypothetical protein
MNFRLFLILAIVFASATACVKRPVATKNVNNATVATYKEDVSAFRPKYQVESGKTLANSTVVKPNQAENRTMPTGDITKKLDVVLDTIAIRNRNIRFAQGFRIQIYSGGSREEANRARDRSYALAPNAVPHIVYTQPTFRVKVGDFMDRLEAQRVYALLLPAFPNALIVPERIEIR